MIQRSGRTFSRRPRSACVAMSCTARLFVVIGDTVHDVTAGHSIDAKVVAVSNDFGREQDLRDAGADTILPDCMDLDAALAAILDSSP